jgi:hypothetical protein
MGQENTLNQTSGRSRSAKYILRFSLLTLMFSLQCAAQDTPAWQFFGGYSFERADVREYYKTTPIIYTFRHHYVNMNGWELSVTENRNRWFGGTLDVSGYYRTPKLLAVSNRENIYSILYGPRFSFVQPFGTPFAHVMFGAAHTSTSVTPTGPHASDFSFAMAIGGGFDLPLKKNTAIRVLQADYLRTTALGSGQNNYRLSAGVIFNLGEVK